MSGIFLLKKIRGKITAPVKASHLYQIHILQGQSCLLQNLCDCRYRACLEIICG